jgi:hypothetical protein
MAIAFAVCLAFCQTHSREPAEQAESPPDSIQEAQAAAL